MCDNCRFRRPFDYLWEEPPVRTEWTTSAEHIPPKTEIVTAMLVPGHIYDKEDPTRVIGMTWDSPVMWAHFRWRDGGEA